jgi:predicted O-methyltransferase YrrM
MVFLVAALVVLAQPPGGERAPDGAKEDRGAPGGQKLPPGPFGPMRMPVMTALDVNGDGELSAEEIAGASQALSQLDKSGDGKLGREELAPVFAGRGGPGGPPGRGPGPGRPGGFGGFGGPGPAASGPSPTFQADTQPKDEGERAILAALEDIQQKQGRRMNVPAADGRLLRTLAEALDAKTVVEFGTSNGVSAIWFSLALRKTDGKLITHEFDPETAALARKNFVQAGVAEIVTVVEGDGHEKASELKGPIDLVFIDADKEGYLDYFQKTLPLVRPGGVICAHNMNARQASGDFVKAITTNPDVETLFYMEGGGMSVTLKKR